MQYLIGKTSVNGIYLLMLCLVLNYGYWSTYTNLTPVWSAILLALRTFFIQTRIFMITSELGRSACILDQAAIIFLIFVFAFSCIVFLSNSSQSCSSSLMQWQKWSELVAFFARRSTRVSSGVFETMEKYENTTQINFDCNKLDDRMMWCKTVQWCICMHIIWLYCMHLQVDVMSWLQVSLVGTLPESKVHHRRPAPSNIMSRISSIHKIHLRLCWMELHLHDPSACMIWILQALNVNMIWLHQAPTACMSQLHRVPTSGINQVHQFLSPGISQVQHVLTALEISVQLVLAAWTTRTHTDCMSIVSHILAACNTWTHRVIAVCMSSMSWSHRIHFLFGLTPGSLGKSVRPSVRPPPFVHNGWGSTTYEFCKSTI